MRSADFSRLSAILGDPDVTIDIRLEFSSDSHNRVLVGGNAKFSPTIECHRCLERLSTAVQCIFNICVVESGEEADQVMEFADPVVVPRDSTTVQELIEDDLILSLPRIACLNQVQCPRDALLADGSEGEHRERPLAAILKLKKNLRFS